MVAKWLRRGTAECLIIIIKITLLKNVASAILRDTNACNMTTSGQIVLSRLFVNEVYIFRTLLENERPR